MDSQMLAKSQKIIEKVKRKRGRTLVLFSGGKDSLAVLLLALQCNIKEASVTGHLWLKGLISSR